MARRIILLSDGTGNSSAKVWRTNVWRTFEAIDLAGSEQVAFYDDGVGTSSFKPLAILGGAFGFGLKRNVIDIYKFACRNVRADDDEIFGFGFSRGAFTMRVVTGLIINQGLVTAQSEGELDLLARAAYRQYRSERFHTYLGIEKLFRALRDLFIRSGYDRKHNRVAPRIRFLGLWDTVAAYGLPIEEMTTGVSKWIWPLELPDHQLNEKVERACHALSIDDERTTFHPVLWNERNIAPPKPDANGDVYTAQERISQVWFTGMHSNVGGGYPDDSVAHIPLVWIMAEAEACGLQFKASPAAAPDTFLYARSARDKDGRLYDPRAGLAGFYRYGPRSIASLCSTVFSRSDEVFVQRPKIHETVLNRIQNAAHSYAPLGLPAVCDVVTDDRRIISADKAGSETLSSAASRANAQEAAWNTVWWRRIVYFLSVGVVAYFVIYPLSKALPEADEYASPLRWVSDLLRLVGTFLPKIADPWLNAYARGPALFLCVVAAIVVFLLFGAKLEGRIHDKMQGLWRASLRGSCAGSLPTDWVYRFRTWRNYVSLRRFLKTELVPFFSALAIVYLGLTGLSHFAYTIQDDAGIVCQDRDPKPLAPGEQKSIPFFVNDICNNTGVLLEEGVKYSFKFSVTEPWTDRGLPSGIGGFYTMDVPGIWSRIKYIMATPLKRDVIRPWFRVVGRYGAKGGEEVFFDPDPQSGSIDATVRATKTGELFVYVNDAVLGIPGLYSAFYNNNDGKGLLMLRKL